jgi:hypothetical protein
MAFSAALVQAFAAAQTFKAGVLLLNALTAKIAKASKKMA